jgi:histidine triad (HIT) family protein
VNTDCLFCRIVSGELPATVVHETATTLAFLDIRPQAPTHVQVVPKAHHRDAAALVMADAGLAAEVLAAAAAVSALAGLTDGYRLVFNTGVATGQRIFHAHLHVLGGRTLGSMG